MPGFTFPFNLVGWAVWSVLLRTESLVSEFLFSGEEIIKTYSNWLFLKPNLKKVQTMSWMCKKWLFRKKLNQQQQKLSQMRKTLSGLNFFLAPFMGWVRWVSLDFWVIFVSFKKDTRQVFGVLSLPCSILCYIGVAIFSPAIAIAQFLGSLLACFVALGVRCASGQQDLFLWSTKSGKEYSSKIWIQILLRWVFPPTLKCTLEFGPTQLYSQLEQWSSSHNLLSGSFLQNAKA